MNDHTFPDSYRLRELSRHGKLHDFYYSAQDTSRLYPAFGLEKLMCQNDLRRIHRREASECLGRSLDQLADLTASRRKKLTGRLQAVWLRGLAVWARGLLPLHKPKSTTKLFGSETPGAPRTPRRCIMQQTT